MTEFAIPLSPDLFRLPSKRSLAQRGHGDLILPCIFLARDRAAKVAVAPEEAPGFAALVRTCVLGLRRGFWLWCRRNLHHPYRAALTAEPSTLDGQEPLVHHGRAQRLDSDPADIRVVRLVPAVYCTDETDAALLRLSYG